MQNKYQYTVQGNDFDVEIEEVEGNLAKVKVNGTEFEVELKQPINPTRQIVKPKVVAPKPAPAPAASAAPAARPVAHAGNGTAVKAPLPGTVTTLCVKMGDTVNVGDTVVVLEAMKMQNNIEAEVAGTITSILVAQGDTVMEGATLLTIG